MFETLGGPLDRTVNRRWPLLEYSTCAVVGLFFLISEVRRHGFSQPFWPVVLTATFLLSLTWVVTTLRSTVPPTYREVNFRHFILILPLMIFAQMDAFVRPDAVTEIFRAADNGDLETTRLLVKHNPNLVFAKNREGFTALHYAAFHGYVEIAKLLLAEGADVNAKTLRGSTALSVAAADGREDVARLLIDNGANINDADSNGSTALYWAQTRGHERIADLLRQHGGLELPCTEPKSPSR